jgi:hypothetical protein
MLQEKRIKVWQRGYQCRNLTEIITKIKDENAMSKEDIEYLTNGIVRLGANKDSIYGKKVSQIIDAQKEYLRARPLTACIPRLPKPK